MLRLSRAVLLLIVSAPASSAQGRARPAIADSSAAQIMARAGAQVGAIWLQDILRQAGAQEPQAKLDQIADSLVARAIDPASVEKRSDAYTRAGDALIALVHAGSRASLGGHPYAGAFDRLVKVHRQARSRTIRAKALGGMLVSPSHSRAIDYLRGVAESSDATAYDAIEFLITDANGGSWVGVTPTASERQASASALKALASGGRVTDHRAAQLLDLWIQR